MKLFRSATAITKLAFAVAFLSLLTLASVRFVQAAWVPPTSAPPGGNVAAPLNVSGVSQTKQGSLTIGGEFLSLSGGDVLFAADDRGVFWANSSDTTRAHIESASNILFLSPGEAVGSGTEIQGDVKISLLGGTNAGSLTIANPNPIPAGRSLTFNVETDALGADIKSNNVPLYINYDNQQKVQIGSSDANTKLCLNDSGSEENCISSWGGSGYWTLEGTNLLHTQNDAWNVGIGTANIDYKLDVAGDIAIRSQNYLRLFNLTNNAWASLNFDGTNVNANYPWYFTNGTNSIITNGKIGIGTTSPQQPLHVTGNARITGLICNGFANGGKVTTNANGDLICGDDTGGGGGGDTYTVKTDGSGNDSANFLANEISAGANIALSTVNVGGDVKLQISASGGGPGDSLWAGTEGATIYPKTPSTTQVGIGLTDPQNRLEVAWTGGGYQALRRDDADNDINSGDDLGALYFTGDHGGVNDIIGAEIKAKADDSWALNSYTTKLSFFTRPAGGSETERLTIDALGRVGIGTTSPQQPLHVAGNVRFSSYNCTGQTNGGKLTTNANGDIICSGDVGGGGGGDNLGDHVARQNLLMSGYWISNDGNDEGIFVTNAGWIGMGTNSPEGLLHLRTNDDAIVIGGLATANIARIGIASNQGNNQALTLDGNSGVRLYYNSTEGMRLDYDGQVGIGTTTPNQALGVNGGLALSGGIYKLDGTTKFFSDCAANSSIRVINADGTVVCQASGGAGDNLGNHVATQNLQMGSNYISNDGGAGEGINIDTAGRVAISNTPNASGETFQLREPAGGSEWAGFSYDGSNNDLKIAVHAGSQVQTFQIDYEDPVFSFDTHTNADALVIKKDGSVGIGTGSPDTRLMIHQSGIDNNTWLKISTDDTSAQNADSTVLFGAVSSNNWKEAQIQYDERFGLVDKAAGAWRFSISNQGETTIFDSATADAPLFQVADSSNRYGQHHTIAAYNDASAIAYNAVSGFKSGSNARGSGIYGELVSGMTCGTSQICAGIYGSDSGSSTDTAGKWAGYFHGSVNITGSVYIHGMQGYITTGGASYIYGNHGCGDFASISKCQSWGNGTCVNGCIGAGNPQGSASCGAGSREQMISFDQLCFDADRNWDTDCNTGSIYEYMEFLCVSP